MDLVAEEGLRRPDRRDRGRGARPRARARSGRRQGVRGRRGVVGSQAGDPGQGSRPGRERFERFRSDETSERVRSDETSERVQSDETSERVQMTRQSRILLADDQRDVLEALRLLLKGEGYAIETVQSPGAAVRAVEASEFDAVLMDSNYARDTTSGAEGPALPARLRGP